MASKSDTEEKKDGKEGAEAKKGSPLKLIIMIVPTVLLIAGAAYFFLLKPAPAPAGPVVEPKPIPGAIVKIDPISINLAGGHYLKLGFDLQATAAAGAELTGSKALDKAIGLYSGKTIDELSSATGREKTKKELIAEVSEAYEKEVYDIYFTEFVMQ